MQRIGIKEEKLSMKCRKCESRLIPGRTCTKVFLRCSACNTRFDVPEYTEELDDLFEELLANVPMNRF